MSFLFLKRGELYAENQIPKFYFYTDHGVLYGLCYDLLCDREKYGRAVLFRVLDCAQGNVDRISHRICTDLFCDHEGCAEADFPDLQTGRDESDLHDSVYPMLHGLSDRSVHNPDRNIYS